MNLSSNLTYEEEDRRIIASLAEKITENAQYMKNIFKLMPKRISVVDKKNNTYAFYGEKELSLSLYLFFASRYTAKMIAKKCYQGDEGDIIRETIDLYDFPVGRVRLKDGTSKESRLVEAKMKILDFLPPNNNRDPRTHMPFELMGFRIVLDGMEENISKEEALSIAERKVHFELGNAEIEREFQKRGIKGKNRFVMEQMLIESMVNEIMMPQELSFKQLKMQGLE